ncbi:MAG: glycosyltransferase family 4 protein [Ignavibacteriaceae bacterium]|nr:glycosyltransferase family 4 protein [Ignavibacteriaceae bacterium]
MPDFSKHILFLTPGFPKDENDFYCIPPLQEFLIKFHQTYPSVRISVITFQYPYQEKAYYWNELNIIPLGGMNSKIKKLRVWLNCIVEASKIHNDSPVTAIHSLWVGECAMLGNFLSKKFNCEHFCTLMGQDVKASNWYLKLLKKRKIIFIALSLNQANKFYKITERKVDEIIHWGIDDQNFYNNQRDIDLLGVGSLIPLKNYSLLIEAVKHALRIKPTIKCKIAGIGPELSRLKQITEEKGLSNNIEFTGLLSRQEIFKLMQRSKILVHPSRFEGSGFVFAEALVNGMNIVSFNVGYAQAHPKWFIAKNNEEFISIIEKILSAELNFEAINLFPLQETINRYANLYGIN